MSERPALLYLHGVREGEGDPSWKPALEGALAGLGYPGLDGVHLIAPKYPDLLDGVDGDGAVPGFQVKAPTGDAAKRNRREFERRVGALENRLGRHQSVKDQAAGDVVADAALATAVFVQARNYLSRPAVRAAVLERVLDALPASGSLVLVGHSLGSVIAADLVRRLPVGVRVVGMITIGSPLGSASFDVAKLRDALKEPPVNLSWWVNVWNANDMVSAMRGVSAVFPWMLDLRIRANAFPRSHAAGVYLSEAVVAEAVGYALFGSRSREIAHPELGAEIPLDDVERLTLAVLRYGYLISGHLKGDQAERFIGARRLVQAAEVDRLRRRNQESGRPLPVAVAGLVFDASDPDSEAPVPPPARYLHTEEAVVLCTALAYENVVRPYEVSVSRDAQQKAMSDLTAEMGLGSKLGSEVFEAAREARAALSSVADVNWLKWGALGVGAAALVVATGGLALAAAPGVAGAAAVTSALAAFGPGGMIGGLLTAGALVTAGGGGIAYGLASPDTSAETLAAVIERQLTAEILRKRLGLESDPGVWRNLVEVEIEVRRQYERLDEFSDRDAPSLKELRRKLDAVARALAYLTKQGLAPAARLPVES